MQADTANERLLLIVEDSFQISGRGRVLAPGLPTTTDLVFGKGAPVHLVRPDGQVTETVIQAIEAVHMRRMESPTMVFMITLPKTISAEEVTKGTRVILI
ncbi:hypothetical protein [Roseateles sp. P5_E11]